MGRGRLLGAVLATALTGCGGLRSAPPPLPKIDAQALREAAALGAGDVVEVRVYREKDLTGSFQISEDGGFSYPLVGRVQAEGLTPITLAARLAAALGEKYLRDPQVSVFVKEYNSKKVFVLGQVKRPGSFRFKNDMTIIQAISLAGGFKQVADPSRISMIRDVNGREQTTQVSVGFGPDEKTNFRLEPGDIIYVPETWL